jgi:hypothetical protein
VGTRKEKTVSGGKEWKKGAECAMRRERDNGNVREGEKEARKNTE